MKKNYQLKIIFSLFILGIIIFSTGATVFLTKQKIIRPSIFAEGNCSGGPDDGQGCSNGGNLLNGCNWVCNNAATPGTVLKSPSCCEIVAQTGDPTACCFDARRRCTPQQCSSIPEGVKRERCAQLWELGGYCNEIPPAPISIPPTVSPTQKPTFIPPSTATPQPTEKIIQPTTILKTVPTFDIRPTIDAFPTTITLQNIPPSQSLQFEFPSIQFPKLTLPKAQINLVQINQLAQKPMGIIEYIFRRILYYDKKLENTVNEQLRKL